ncbi:MAG: hypothetical protein WAT67_04080 [Candidatus Contendobacter sp.]
MATFHGLRAQRRELLNDLETLETDITAQTAMLNTASAVSGDPDDHLAWLQRQRAGLLVLLSEAERALLEFSADGWDE